MKITRSTLKNLIKEEMRRNEDTPKDMSLLEEPSPLDAQSVEDVVEPVEPGPMVTQADFREWKDKWFGTSDVSAVFCTPQADINKMVLARTVGIEGDSEHAQAQETLLGQEIVAYMHEKVWNPIFDSHPSSPGGSRRDFLQVLEDIGCGFTRETTNGDGRKVYAAYVNQAYTDWMDIEKPST
jgi:hypothetical protein